jgi:hypothetical protein
MDVQLIGAWGELVGGVASLIAALGVIATLLYLARQIQQNTRSVQSANYGTWIDSISALHDIHVQIADFLDDAMNDTRELTADEYWKFHDLCLQAMYALEAVFLFRENGTVDQIYFESRMRMMQNGMLNHAGFTKWWDEWSADVFDPRFVVYVEQNLKGKASDSLPLASPASLR